MSKLSAPFRRSMAVVRNAGQQLVKIWSDALCVQAPKKPRPLISPLNKAEQIAVWNPIEIGNLEDLRKAHGILPNAVYVGHVRDRDAEASPLTHHCKGTIGFTVPWSFAGGVRASRGGTVQLEVHKSEDGIRYLIGFVEPGTLRVLEENPRAEITISVSPWRTFRQAVAIPFVKILHAEHRSGTDMEHPYLLDIRML